MVLLVRGARYMLGGDCVDAPDEMHEISLALVCTPPLTEKGDLV